MENLMIDNQDRAELQNAIHQLHDYVAHMETKPPIFKSNTDNCLNCLHFDEDTEICSLGKSRPPARVIAEGCPSWDIDIPF